MQALVLEKPLKALSLKKRPFPKLKKGEVLLKVLACGVCRTDLEIFEGKVPALLPRVLGHQIVGCVVKSAGSLYKEGDLVGAYWLGKTCNVCSYCTSGQENLCKSALFRGKEIDGGFASHVVCEESYTVSLPKGSPPAKLAPLLCGGLIGFRAYKKLGNTKHIGLYGFGSAAHILLQIAKEEGKSVYVFTKKGDVQGQKLALSLGACFAKDVDTAPPRPLDGSIIFASAGELVPAALSHLERGGMCVCAGIHMSDIPSFSYQSLFFEKHLTCVSNLTREDAVDFFACKSALLVDPVVTTFPMQEANRALKALKEGSVKGSIVLIPSEEDLL